MEVFMAIQSGLRAASLLTGLGAAALAAAPAVAGDMSGVQRSEAFAGDLAGIEAVDTSELVKHRGAGISFGNFFQNIVNATGGESRTLVVLNGRAPVEDSGPGDLSSTDMVTTTTRTQSGTATVTRTRSSTTSTMTITWN
jgi:hypothetical protein